MKNINSPEIKSAMLNNWLRMWRVLFAEYGESLVLNNFLLAGSKMVR